MGRQQRVGNNSARFPDVDRADFLWSGTTGIAGLRAGGHAVNKHPMVKVACL